MLLKALYVIESIFTVDGAWGHWSGWANSHGYQQIRKRKCNNPSQSCGGKDCYGSSTQTRSQLRKLNYQV